MLYIIYHTINTIEDIHTKDVVHVTDNNYFCWIKGKHLSIFQWVIKKGKPKAGWVKL